MADWGLLRPRPRIEPVPLDGADEQTRELLDPLGERASSNFFRTLVRNPRIFKRWVPYSLVLLHGSLPERDRELLVLRAACRSECRYVWASHVPLARGAGLSPEEIERVRQGSADAAWAASDAALLRAADEVIDEHRLGDETWGGLAERYDEPQLIEVPMVVGVYFAMGVTLNSLGVQPEPEDS